MKILWVKGDFLHPTTKGGQIRTLETLKRLHRWHEVHYVGLDYPPNPEALVRAGEYCSHVYPIRHEVPGPGKIGLGRELVRGLWDAWPVSIRRYHSPAMEQQVRALTTRHRFDSIVCDFLNASQNMPDLSQCVLFQHNVEAVIWNRNAVKARNPAARAYFGLQARRMREYERGICRKVRRVIAVSEQDAEQMRRDYGARSVASVPTGVDVEYFAPQPSPAVADLAFVGSMDWMPNIDGVKWFVDEILSAIRNRRPDCSVAIIGRKPTREIESLAASDPRIIVTGTIPDVRPYLWGCTLSIVPLRIGGGTRLKIYESMAARTAVVSTTIGAEGLDVRNGENLLIADEPAVFADHCLRLLGNADERNRIAEAGFELVRSRYSWEAVSHEFEALLRQ